MPHIWRFSRCGHHADGIGVGLTSLPSRVARQRGLRALTLTLEEVLRSQPAKMDKLHDCAGHRSRARHNNPLGKTRLLD